MTEPRAAAAEPRLTAAGVARLTAARDGRLVPYCMFALGGLGAALVAAEPALAALAVPFAIAVVIGLRRTAPVEVTARFVLGAEQVLEGDIVTGSLELTWSGEFDAQVMLHRLKGVAPVADSVLSWSLPAATGNVELPVRLQATQWGLHSPAEVWLKLEAPFGLLAWTGRVVTGPALRVLPGAERLSRLLDPADARTVLGAHRSPRLGNGDEFAELRHYSPGDRLRDLNWSATARHGRPFVNRRHPELSGDVVIALDAFADGSTASTVALARAARVAWALTSIHLRANDRVGLAGLGGSTQWLPPGGGRLARYKLLETLLRIGGEAADPVSVQGGGQRVRVPASALVIVLTPLQDPGTLSTLQAWRAHGRSVAVVMIDTADIAGEPASPAEALARRLWLVESDLRKRDLAEIGVPVVTATGDGAITPVVSALRRARRARFTRRGR